MRFDDIKYKDIQINSRKVTKGSLFICIVGSLVDGHDYAVEAVKNGAVAVVAKKDMALGVPVIVVPDTEEALAELAARFHGNPADRLKLIGVTGTNGKTTVTYLVKSILESQGKKVGLIGTNKNMIGDKPLYTEQIAKIPLCIEKFLAQYDSIIRKIPRRLTKFSFKSPKPVLNQSSYTTPDALALHSIFAKMVEEDCEYVVMEVSSHALSRNRVFGCKYAVGAFMNLTPEHLDFHKTMENYFDAKAKLFNMSDKKVVNIDDEYGAKLALQHKCTTFGMDVASEVELEDRGVRFVYNGVPIFLGIPGRFNVYNAMAAIEICKQIGIPIKDIAAALGAAKGVKGRVEVVPTDTDYTVLIDYAHTPDSLRNVLETVRDFCTGRLIVVFGCGGDRDKTKRPIMGKISMDLSDVVIVTSDNPRSEPPMAIIDEIVGDLEGCVVIENRREAIKKALEIAEKNDIIILAGKGHETYQILGDETIPFDEREVVRGCLAL